MLSPLINPPTCRFLAIATPPAIFTAPVSVSVLSVVFANKTVFVAARLNSVSLIVKRFTPPVKKSSSSLSEPGLSSAIILVSWSTSIVPPRLFHATPS